MQFAEVRSVDAHLGLAQCCMRLHDTLAAHAAYMQALHLQPHCAAAWAGLATVYVQVQDHPRAVLCYQVEASFLLLLDCRAYRW
jgi:Tfp pilus assembly protein PilF